MNNFLLLGLMVGAGLIGVLWSQPRWLLSIVSRMIPGVTYFVRTRARVVALTIDDGPDSVNTPKILDVLSQHQARATFFLISSRVENHQSLTAKIINQGHEIGNHLTEDEPSIKLSAQELEQKLLEADRILCKFTQPLWLRPASGWYNKKMLQVARQHGYQVALGSVFPYDTHIHSVDFAIGFILWNVRPGSIIVLHDGAESGDRTAKILGRVLPVLKQRGYSVVSLSELRAIGLQPVSN